MASLFKSLKIDARIADLFPFLPLFIPVAGQAMRTYSRRTLSTAAAPPYFPANGEKAARLQWQGSRAPSRIQRAAARVMKTKYGERINCSTFHFFSASSPPFSRFDSLTFPPSICHDGGIFSLAARLAIRFSTGKLGMHRIAAFMNVLERLKTVL